MFQKIKQLWKEFDEEILKKDEQPINQKRGDPEAKKAYEQAEFDFKGAR